MFIKDNILNLSGLFILGFLPIYAQYAVSEVLYILEVPVVTFCKDSFKSNDSSNYQSLGTSMLVSKISFVIYVVFR